MATGARLHGRWLVPVPSPILLGPKKRREHQFLPSSRRSLAVYCTGRSTYFSDVVAVAAAVVTMNVVGSSAGKRRVMVVADPTRESAGALEWALYQAVLEHDEIILLHVESPCTRRLSSLSTLLRRPPTMTSSSMSIAAAGAIDGGNGDYEFLDTMRAKCEAAQPKVKVQIEKVETGCKDKATIILLKTKLLSVDLLVIGQRRTSGSFLRYKLLSSSLSSKGTDTAEFLIENSKCLCVAVQKKGQSAGYLLNTKTHKNFWLLA